jgi:hypothetical protein
MAQKDYWDARDAVIKFLDELAPHKALRARYLQPPEKPTYSAATTMHELGLGGSALAGNRQRLNELLRAEFGDLLKLNIGSISIGAITDIGGLIKLAAARLKLGVPDGEPA